mgnify:CR=1 FL=1
MQPRGGERYEFTWPGKNAAMIEANTSTTKTLRPCLSESVDWDNTGNVYIKGDNLTALKIIQDSHLGAIKLIYVDPPYNTGSDFVFRDDYSVERKEFGKMIGAEVEEGNRLFENTNANGRFHSDWCSMIYPRLLISKTLLRKDGAIFISIDDNELNNLLNICDEMFGKTNHVATIPWRKRTAKSDVPFGVSQDYEWIVAYAKSDEYLASIEGKRRKYYTSEDYPENPWRVHDLTKQTTATGRPNSFFTMVNPKTKEEYPADPNRTWAITNDTFEKYYAEGRVIFPGDYDFLRISKPVLRYFKTDDMKKAGEMFGNIAVSTKLPDDIGMSQDGTKEITSIFGKKMFSIPKPTSLIDFIIRISTNLDDDDIILDFFSGSATTAHSVMKQNALDGKRRKFVLVQVPENCAEKLIDAHESGFETICDVGMERIRRVGKEISKGDVGFRVFSIDSSNMKDVYFSSKDYSQTILDGVVDNIKDDRSDLNLLSSVIIGWGLKLSLPYETIIVAGKKVHNVDKSALVACFESEIDENVVRSIAEMNPSYAVFRDHSFRSSSNKINLEEIFKMKSPDTVIRVI